MLLKKQTSVGEQPNMGKKDIVDETHHIENINNEPTSIHHRKNPITGMSS